MDRQKVIELAREAGLAYGSDEKPLSSVERFAALIEREVRGDSEPVAYETDQELWAADAPDINNWIRKNGRPLYRHPTPAVVRQLVDALRMVLDDPDALDGRPRTYECVQEALAAAKESGL